MAFEREAYQRTNNGERSCDRNYTKGWRKGVELVTSRAHTVKEGENLIRRCNQHGYDGLIRVVSVSQGQRGFENDGEGSTFKFIFVGRDGVTKATSRTHDGSIGQGGKSYFRARLSHASADKAAKRVPSKQTAAKLLKAAAAALERGF